MQANQRNSGGLREMKHLRLTGGLLAIAACPAFTSSVLAADFTIQPRVSIGYQNYEFDLDVNNNFDVDTEYTFGGLGITGQTGKFFIDLYGQTNLTDAEFDENNFVVVDTIAVEREASIDRNELNLTLGYAFTPMITAFGGLKYAKNEIDQEFNSNNALADAIFANDFVNFENEYIGPFVGAAFSIPVADIGSFSLNGSLAYLDGESTLDLVVQDLVVDDASIDGTAIGYGVGATWSGRFAALSSSLSSLGFSMGVDYSSYDFEDDGDDVYAERTLRVRTDLKYQF
ncbi:MAG: hypothetical protein ACR2QF_08375 [Geminicoccaceae bacterium]